MSGLPRRRDLQPVGTEGADHEATRALWHGSGHGRHGAQRDRSLRALDAFRLQDPVWVNSGFDLYLLRNDAAAALAEGDPEALAPAWCNQFGYRDPRRRARDERLVRPLAEAFLKLWADELDGARSVGVPVVREACG